MSSALFLQEPPPASSMGLGLFLHTFWPVLVPALLGAVAVYWFLPRAGRQIPPLGGALLGALALVFVGVFLARTETVWIETLLFLAFAGIAVASGVLLVTQSNSVYAALSFALVVLSTCGLFLMQAAPFLMAATIIIYAGAIIVTFLFVIMLAQQSGMSNADHRSREPFLGTLTGFVLMAAIVCVLYRSVDTREIDRVTAQVEELAKAKNEAEIRQAMVGEVEGQTTILANQLMRYLPGNNLAAGIEERWNDLTNPRETEVNRKRAASLLPTYARDLLPALRERRAGHGTLALVAPVRNDAGKLELRRLVPGKRVTPGTLPGRNVAALGQTLFTDYLIPVALAAVLLLIATIGAIAVAHRGGEEVR